MIRDYIKYRERQSDIKEIKKFAVGMTIGTILGAGVGILIAPRKGKETRENLKLFSEEVLENIKNAYDNTVVYTKEWKDNVTDEVCDTFENIKYKVDHVLMEDISYEDKKKAIKSNAKEIK